MSRNRNRAHTKLLQDIRLELGQEPDLVLWPISPSAPGSHVRTAPLGITDLFGILDLGSVGVAVFIEVKTGRAKLNADQVMFRDLVVSMHAIHIVARSVADAVNGIAFARKRLPRTHRRAA